MREQVVGMRRAEIRDVSILMDAQGMMAAPRITPLL
jgi:hypothetical protein